MRGCLRHIQQTDEAIEALCDAGDRLMQENDALRAELAAARGELVRLRSLVDCPHCDGVGRH